MCGDLETDESRAEEFYTRFVDHTCSFLAAIKSENAGATMSQLHAYLDALFQRTLTAATECGDVPEDVSGYERLSMEPLVYARLAGFMAAHQPLEEDPMRRLIDAIMMGYEEGEAMMTSEGAHHHSHAHTH